MSIRCKSRFGVEFFRREDEGLGEGVVVGLGICQRQSLRLKGRRGDGNAFAGSPSPYTISLSSAWLTHMPTVFAISGSSRPFPHHTAYGCVQTGLFCFPRKTLA